TYTKLSYTKKKLVNHQAAILCKSYLELQTSKLDNLGSLGKLRQRSKTSHFMAQLRSTICNVKCEHNGLITKSTNYDPESMLIRDYDCDLNMHGRMLDRTFHRLLRNPRNSEVVNSSVIASNLSNIANFGVNSDSDSANIVSDLKIDCHSNIAYSDSDLDFGVGISQLSLDNMANNDKTLKELATSIIIYKLGVFDILNWNKLNHMSLSEDPHKHLKEGILEGYIKMKAFPFSLDGAAKEWLYLQPILFMHREK
ncbi:hypothetical protein CR513_15052, partial [Mucuna pruriens]